MMRYLEITYLNLCSCVTVWALTIICTKNFGLYKTSSEIPISVIRKSLGKRSAWQLYTSYKFTVSCVFITFDLQHTNDVLSAFSTIKLDERRNRSKWDEADVSADVGIDETSTNAGNVQQYFAKYLTSQNLLELQLGDSNFRRYILLQFLIIFQYLDSPVKFKQ